MIPLGQQAARAQRRARLPDADRRRRRPARANSFAPGVCSAGARSPAQRRNACGSPSQASRRARARSRGRPRRGSARAGARRARSSSPTPGSAVAAARSARLRRPGRAARWARRAARCGAGRRAPRRARRAASLPPRARAWGGRAASRCRARAPPPRPRARPPPRRAPRLSSASASSARTELITSCVSGSWKSTPTNAPRRAGPCSRVSRPASVTRPAKRPPWKCGTRPQAARSSVDLPCPERPASRQNSPGWTSQAHVASASASPPG